MVPSTELSADGAAYPSTAVTSYAASSVLDGNPGTLWMPPLDKPRSGRGHGEVRLRPGQSTLILGFRDGKKRDVRLVCAVNGLASSPQRYRSWGRIRTVQTKTDVDNRSHLSVLRTLDDGSFQNGQEINLHRGSTATIKIDVIDTYHGQIVEEYDPDICNARAIARDPRLQWRSDKSGCVVAPQPFAGFSEVQVYEWDGSRWDYIKAMLLGRGIL
jgi:hypothetical protein